MICSNGKDPVDNKLDLCTLAHIHCAGNRAPHLAAALAATISETRGNIGPHTTHRGDHSGRHQPVLGTNSEWLVCLCTAHGTAVQLQAVNTLLSCQPGGSGG